MMTTLAMYAVSAALYAAAPTDQGYDPAQAAGSGSDPAAAQVAEQGRTEGDASSDPSQALARARRPRPRSDSASQRALSRDEIAPPAPSEVGPTDESLRQQEIWTAP